MWLVDVSIRRAVFAVMMIGSLVVLGLVGLQRLGLDLFPNVEFPYVSIVTTLEGASPETIETEVTDVIEESVNTISGINLLRSVSADGTSQVFIEFELDEDINVKAQDVRDKVAVARRNLPLDVDPPIVEKIDPDGAPIVSVMIAGDLPIGEITTFAEEVAKEALQRLPGVGSVTVVGGRKREIRVWMDVIKLRALSVTAEDVIRAVRAEHTELPGGRMEVEGGLREFGVKTIAEARSATELGELVVAFQPGGIATKIKDVARVEDGLADERTFALLDGSPGISLEIRRQSGRNAVEVSRAVSAEVEALRATAPPGLNMIVARDTSRFIEASIEDVTKELEIAILLVVLVTFFFLLSWRATIIVATAIPTSLIATFFIFDVFDFTLNTLTLLALTSSIGLLVDDAIVVIEAIQRDVDRGHAPSDAASAATRRVGLAVLAGTLSTIAVFVPIAFMEGIVGQFFFQYGLAIVFSVTVSLLVAMTLTPMLSSRFLNKAHGQGAILGAIEGFHQSMDSLYGRVVRWSVKHRYLVLLGALATIFLGAWFAAQIPGGFTGKADRSEFLAIVELPTGTGIAESKHAAQRLNDVLKTVEHVQSVFATVAGGVQQKANQIELYVKLTPKQQRSVTQLALMDRARDIIITALPNATKINLAEVPWISGGGISNADIEFVIRGDDMRVLREYAERLTGEMRGESAFADVRTSYEVGRPEVQISVDRLRAADLGISARTIATTTRSVIGGEKAGTFEDNGKRYDIRVRLEESQRQDVNQLGLIPIRSMSRGLIDLASVASINTSSGPAQIDRQDRARKISVFANATSGVALGTATSRLQDILDRNPPPKETSGKFEGQARRMKETVAAIGFAFMLALVALYIVLASQFNSFVQPLVIMLTAPLCFSGAFAALFFTGKEMSMFAQIGMIALMGIVMKNGILLVDRANQLREAGEPAGAAIAIAGPERLRPVLMTASAAVFGMIPVALSTSDASEWRTAMGLLIIGGLTSSTLLTLAVVPAAYMVPGDVAAFSKEIVSFVVRQTDRLFSKGRRDHPAE